MSPVLVEPEFLSGAGSCVQIACGRFQTGVISAVGEVCVWGSQVVDGWFRDSKQLRPFIPEIVVGLRAVQLGFSDAASVILTDTG